MQKHTRSKICFPQETICTINIRYLSFDLKLFLNFSKFMLLILIFPKCINFPLQLKRNNPHLRGFIIFKISGILKKQFQHHFLLRKLENIKYLWLKILQHILFFSERQHVSLSLTLATNHNHKTSQSFFKCALLSQRKLLKPVRFNIFFLLLESEMRKLVWKREEINLSLFLFQSSNSKFLFVSAEMLWSV